MTDYELENELRHHLSSGEKLVWAGRPKKGIMFRGTDILMIPFSLMWGGFAIFWETTVITSGAPFFFTIWGIPFVLVGLYITVGRFFWDAKQRAKTVYGVTNNRVIIRSGIIRPEIKSLNLKTLSDVSFTEKRDGSGTITFGDDRNWYSWKLPRQTFGKRPTPALEMIPDVKQVYDKIIELQQS